MLIPRRWYLRELGHRREREIVNGSEHPPSTPRGPAPATAPGVHPVGDRHRRDRRMGRPLLVPRLQLRSGHGRGLGGSLPLRCDRSRSLIPRCLTPVDRVDRRRRRVGQALGAEQPADTDRGHAGSRDRRPPLGRGPQLLRPQRSRLQSHRPGRHRGGPNRCVDDHPAGRQAELPERRSHHRTEDLRSPDRVGTRTSLHEGPDPRVLRQLRVLRVERVRFPGGRPGVLRQGPRRIDPRPGGDPRHTDPQPDLLPPEEQSAELDRGEEPHDRPHGRERVCDGGRG